METRDTPGVYVDELSAFPAAIVGVATAVPAFIGYSEQAQDPASGGSLTNRPTPIESLADYEAAFGGGPATMFRLEPAGDADGPDIVLLEGESYRLAPDSGPWRLYDSVRLFYANGGGPCLVVSVGGYDGSGVELADLQAGLAALASSSGPTILAAPDAAALPAADAEALAAAMIGQAAELQDRVALIDALPGESIGDWPAQLAAIEAFMAGAAARATAPSFGIAYFPFLDTTLHPPADVTYLNLAGDAATKAAVANILADDVAATFGGTVPPALATAIAEALAELGTPPNPQAAAAAAARNAQLSAALPSLRQLEAAILVRLNRLPPSGAIAGVYAYNDNARGVWNAPANVTLAAVAGPAVPINDDQQGDLNVPLSGLAVNAIRPFTGRGSVVWGARTMDGNSNDYRYVQVRRTLIYVSQSIELALRSFVSAPNSSATWVAVTAMISNFLTVLWSEGGLMGSSADDAFTVQCGLGSTMTGQDILDGVMIVQVTLQMIHPAEFIELTFRQQMERGG